MREDVGRAQRHGGTSDVEARLGHAAAEAAQQRALGDLLGRRPRERAAADVSDLHRAQTLPTQRAETFQDVTFG